MDSGIINSFRKLRQALTADDGVPAVLKSCAERQHTAFTWFVPEYCQYSLKALEHLVSESSLDDFYKRYALRIQCPEKHPRKTAVVSTNQTPLEIFGDIVLVLLSGHNFYGKAESSTTVFLEAIMELFLKAAPEISGRIEFAEKIENAEAIIADVTEENEETFRRYFSKIPAHFRKGRHSAAVIAGNETTEELLKLAEDIVTYFGRGRFSVRKLFVPEGYDFSQLFRIISEMNSPLLLHNQYLNNLEYQKTTCLMAQRPFMDAGAMIFVESEADSPPTGVVYFEKYRESILSHKCERLRGRYSRIVASTDTAPGCCPFGMSNMPSASDLLYDETLKELLFEKRQK